MTNNAAQHHKTMNTNVGISAKKRRQNVVFSSDEQVIVEVLRRKLPS